MVEKVLKDGKTKKADIEHIVLVGGSTRIPFVRKRLKKLFGKEPRTEVDPDKAVAYGAAIQAAILLKVRSSKIDDILLVDVTPLSLGIETAGKIFTPIIEKNAKIPTRKTQTFTTMHSEQTEVQIKILQGVNKLARKNKELGRFSLEGIAKNHPEIAITLEINANGIVTCHAVEKGNGKEHKIEITNAHSISEEELSKMMEEAERTREEDDREAEIVQLQESIKSGYTRAMESGQVDEKLRKKMDEIRAQAEQIQSYTEEDLEKMKELSSEFMQLTQGAGAGKEGEKAGEEDEEDEEDEEL